jgi:hypothetical protein
VFSWNLSLVLSIELIQKVPEGFESRVSYYNIISLVFSALLTYLAYATNSFGQSFSGLCYLKPGSFAEHSIWVYFFYSPFVFVSFFCQPGRDFAATQSMLLVFWLFGLPFAISQLFSMWIYMNEVLIVADALTMSSSGLMVYLVSLIYYFTKHALEVPLLHPSSDNLEEDLSELKKYKLAVISLLSIIESSPMFVFNQYQDLAFNSQKSWEVPKEFNEELACLLPCTIVQHSGEYFANICVKDNISKSELVECLNSMKRDNDLVCRIKSYSHNFLIKFVTAEQLSYVLSILPKFYKHLFETSKNKSVLNRIIGAFTLRQKRNAYNFIILQNVIYGNVECEKFELSGSKLVKQICERGKIMNDLDFMKRHSRIFLTYPERNLLLRVCKDDLEFLKASGVLDYYFFIAIIDKCNKIGLTSRFTRHFFDGKNKKVYAIVLVNTFNSERCFSPSHLTKVGGPKGYSERLSNLLSKITQCEDF